MFSIIRQLEEKNVAHEIDLLIWSDCMDLVAFSNVKGEVALHRLNWTRAWNLGPPKDGMKVKAMAWRPDGKVLAIGYDSGSILLINVENKSVLNTIEVSGNISCITWIQEKKNQNKNSKILQNDEEEQKPYAQYIDYSSIFLPTPQNLSSYSSPSVQEDNNTNFLKTQTELNFLAVGTTEGFVYFSIFGCFSCATINLNEHLEIRCSVLDIYLSENLSRVFVTVKDIENNVKIVFLNSEIFNTHSKELFCISLKNQQLNSLLQYVSNAISTIKETWESILLEMDAKLSKYAAKIPAGTLSTDFLDLLMFGICSEDMQEFLLHDLTKKGLEKFGQTIEMSYANIQKLLLKNVTKVGQNITYHLAELKGMARLEHRYKLLGLDENKITSAVGSNGSFLIKSGEMQQIINNSMLYYKAFFRWLYTAIIHLMEESVPPEIPKMTQQDLAYISEFLQFFDFITDQNNTTIGGTEKTGFIMERLGQYLAENPLTILPNMELNDWDSFLQQNECIKKHPLTIKHYKEMSLVQQFRHLESTLVEIFDEPHKLISKEIRLETVIDCVNIPENKTRITSVNTSNGTLLSVFLPSALPAEGFYIVEFSTTTAKAALVSLKQNHTKPDQHGDKYLVRDIKFYSENILSVLLEENSPTKFGVLFQCPIVFLRDKMQEINLNVKISAQEIVNIDAGEQNVLKNVGMSASKFSVSGCRRVSVVLSENEKKVMVFEMEGEEEEEEDADMTNSTIRESDASMQENSDAE